MRARTDPSDPTRPPDPPSLPDPPELIRVLPSPSASLTAEQVVEGLRLWETPPDVAWSERGGRPRVLLNMACTADGRATVGGRSGPIGDRADRALFHALRAAVDAVLVGAGTVRAERYRRLVRDETRRRLRAARGLAEEPLACIVSAGLRFPPDIPLLADPDARVVILTSSPDRELTAGTTSVEYVRAGRAGRLDLPAALGELHARLGVRTLLCEGGPHLNGQLFAAGLVDELFLSLAPKLAGGGAGDGVAGSAAAKRDMVEGTGGAPAERDTVEDGTGGPGAAAPLRIIRGPELDPPLELELLAVLESESQLLLRYRVLG